MAFEVKPPHLPTIAEIREKALELFYKKHPGAPTPEDEELKEGSFWESARLELMSGYEAELEEYRRYLLGELDRIKGELDSVLSVMKEYGFEPPEWTKPKDELIERVVALQKERDKYRDKLDRIREEDRKTKKLLEEAREEIKKLREALKAPAPPPPPTPPAPPEVKPPPAPPPKLIPEIPEKCPIDGSPLSEVTRVPIGPVPIRLSAEEEYLRARLGLPLPEMEMVWLDVPVTMKLYHCQQDHLFERDPVTGRLVQRTPEYVYRKILRETAALRRITAPPPTPPAPPIVYYPPPPPRPTKLQDVFWDWLERTKGLTREQFMALSWEEREKIRKEWGDWVRRTG